MSNVGIYVSQMHFSGFWSQGDGASFEGHISDLALFVRKHDIKAPAILSLLSEDSFNGDFDAYVRGYYVHSHCMHFESYVDFTGPDYDEPLLQAAMAVKNDLAEKEWDELTRNLAPGIFRGHADDLYQALEAEYDYLTSDEQVLEALIANNQLEEELGPRRTQESHQSQDTASVQELLLRPAGALPEDGRAP